MQINGLRIIKDSYHEGKFSVVTPRGIIWEDRFTLPQAIGFCFNTLDFVSRSSADATVKKAWNNLEDVLFIENGNGTLVLNDDWLCFEKGTTRETIWEWFNTHYSKGLQALI